MESVLLVAGSDHRKLAYTLHQSLSKNGVQLHVITGKSNRNTLLTAVEKSPQVIWLVNPQTIYSKPYQQIRALLQHKGEVEVAMLKQLRRELGPDSPAQLEQRQAG